MKSVRCQEAKSRKAVPIILTFFNSEALNYLYMFALRGVTDAFIYEVAKNLSRVIVKIILQIIHLKVNKQLKKSNIVGL